VGLSSGLMLTTLYVVSTPSNEVHSNSVVTAIALKKEGEDAAKIFEDADRTVKVAILALKIAPLVVVRLVAINLPPQLRPSLAVESAGIMMPVTELPKKGRGWL